MLFSNTVSVAPPSPPPPPPSPPPVPQRSAAFIAAMNKLQDTMPAADFALLDMAFKSSPSLTQRFNDQIGKSITSLVYDSRALGALYRPGSDSSGFILFGRSILNHVIYGTGSAVQSSAIRAFVDHSGSYPHELK